MFRTFLANATVSMIGFVSGGKPIKESSLLIKPKSKSALCIISVSFLKKSITCLLFYPKVFCFDRKPSDSPPIFLAPSDICLSGLQ